MKQSIMNSVRIARARRTRIGRIVCRLMGDQTGGVLMEYVLLGLLVVAAVAGVVIAFGDSISTGLKAMSRTVRGETEVAETQLQTDRTANEGKITAGETHRAAVQK